MEVLLTYKESNIEVKIEEGEDSLSKLRQALLIALNSHPGCSAADYSAATDRCQFQRWSERWDCYVNIASSDDVRANDKIVPLFKSETSPQVSGYCAAAMSLLTIICDRNLERKAVLFVAA